MLEVEAAKSVFAAKAALSALAPGCKVVVNTAIPFAATDALPSAEPASRNVTDPVGGRVEGELTVAVSVTLCPGYVCPIDALSNVAVVAVVTVSVPGINAKV